MKTYTKEDLDRIEARLSELDAEITDKFRKIEIWLREHILEHHLSMRRSKHYIKTLRRRLRKKA